jgi:hypothetical protein|tara:strand:- start:187 stop:432 length:246 start_codon:yes stop_codon:yes gene_type:complete
MIGFIILTATLSLLVIALVHTMFNYFVNVFTVETVKDPIHISSVQETLMANIHKGPPVNSPPASFVNTTNENIMINPSEYM